jgi:hypothetical protein
MRRIPALCALAAAFAVCAFATAPAVAVGVPGLPIAAAPASQAVAIDGETEGGGGPSVPRPLLLLIAAAALVATAGAIWQERGSPRALAHGRVVRRRRREVGATTYQAARRAGFRYSDSRDALVLRGVGNSVGPVLRLRGGQAPTPIARPERNAPGRRERLVDLVCLPLPDTTQGRLWQLTAVDVDTRFTWAELTRPRGAAPSPEQALAFMRRVAAHLGGRGLRLDAVVVQAGSTHRRVLATAVELADVRLLRALPGPRRHPIAAQRHQEIVTAHWDHVLASTGAPPLDLLERQLQRWVALDNETPGASLAGGLSPSDALGGAPVVAAPATGGRPDRAPRDLTPGPTTRR